MPHEITRVLLNLFGNGFYATKLRKTRASQEGYEPELRITTRGLGDTVEIHVRDNGIGMPDSVVEKIFTPFYTTKPTGEGTGLGLSLSYDIVVQHHRGRFEVDSREGEFTEFIIRLPRHAHRASSDAAGQQP